MELLSHAQVVRPWVEYSPSRACRRAPRGGVVHPHHPHHHHPHPHLTHPVELVEEHPEDEKHEEDGETDGDNQPIGGGLPPSSGGTFQVGCKETHYKGDRFETISQSEDDLWRNFSGRLGRSTLKRRELQFLFRL